MTNTDEKVLVKEFIISSFYDNRKSNDQVRNILFVVFFRVLLWNKYVYVLIKHQNLVVRNPNIVYQVSFCIHQS